MGTNYFLKAQPKCAHCGRGPGQGLHIGKSSGGWTFALRVYVEDDAPVRDAGIESPIRDLADWLPLFEHYGVVDEYWRDVTVADMVAAITQRSHPNGLLSRSSSRDGQHLKARVGGDTYDLVEGEFS